jgi:hypothetical protein
MPGGRFEWIGAAGVPKRENKDARKTLGKTAVIVHHGESESTDSSKSGVTD